MNENHDTKTKGKKKTTGSHISVKRERAQCERRQLNHVLNRNLFIAMRIVREEVGKFSKF